MKKFLGKILLLAFMSVISILIVYAGIAALQIRLTDLAYDAFYVIEKAGHNSGLPVVVLGDSVAKQLWPQEKDSPNLSHMSSTNGITTVGNYLLLKKYLEHNPQTKKVVYAVRPQSLANDLDMEYTYQYFVIPFMDSENSKLIEEETRQKLDEKFGKIFVENKYIKCFLLNNNLFMTQYMNHVRSQTDELPANRISPITAAYLRKMKELCEEHKAELYVMSVPMQGSPENYVWDDFEQEVRDYGLEDILGEFIEKMPHYPEDWFRDGIHFKPSILAEHLDELRASVMD